MGLHRSSTWPPPWTRVVAPTASAVVADGPAPCVAHSRGGAPATGLMAGGGSSAGADAGMQPSEGGPPASEACPEPSEAKEVSAMSDLSDGKTSPAVVVAASSTTSSGSAPLQAAGSQKTGSPSLRPRLGRHESEWGLCSVAEGVSSKHATAEVQAATDWLATSSSTCAIASTPAFESASSESPTRGELGYLMLMRGVGRESSTAATLLCPAASSGIVPFRGSPQRMRPPSPTAPRLRTPRCREITFGRTRAPLCFKRSL